ncbi:ribosomal protein S18-alanine N-acetyltransferase [Catenovulum adriaticum]|uniref:Ribosomal protein S18-alanine N-acetyltransferase n=1 Tax=Catenovulum adriaticum TaxID=2984846 RepID=A0ABY7AJD6_9ALTE|nr:ribosomal protein S18-alanine N-acetyltransferase [Catenovulum sp. TS8]WAJ69338.1 ribosomal protein S18-alanine N-acetyltransferase [Catenovulum sp. TS8]
MKTLIVPFSERYLAQTLIIEKQAQPNPWNEKIIRSCFGRRYMNFALTLANSDQLLGYVFSDHVAGEVSIMNICISPQYQRKGFAKQLLNHLVSHSQAINAETLWLEVRESNIAARALYNELDFNEIAVRKNYYPVISANQKKPINNKENAIVMSRDLAF